jgi:hypothetical protein
MGVFSVRNERERAETPSFLIQIGRRQPGPSSLVRNLHYYSEWNPLLSLGICKPCLVSRSSFSDRLGPVYRLLGQHSPVLFIRLFAAVKASAQAPPACSTS